MFGVTWFRVDGHPAPPDIVTDSLRFRFGVTWFRVDGPPAPPDIVTDSLRFRVWVWGNLV